MKWIAAARSAKPTSRPIAIAVVVAAAACRRQEDAGGRERRERVELAVAEDLRRARGEDVSQQRAAGAADHADQQLRGHGDARLLGAQRAGDGEEADRERVEDADRAQDPRAGLAGDHRHDDRGRDHRRQVERVGQRDGRVRVGQQQVAQQAAAEAAGERQAEHADEVEAVLPARRERAARRPGGNPE